MFTLDINSSIHQCQYLAAVASYHVPETIVQPLRTLGGWCSFGALRWKHSIIAVDNLQVTLQLKHLPLLCGSGL